MQRFEGTSDYVATDDLKVAVNAAVQLRRPLLVKGEPGTGKTVLAYEIARAAKAELIEWTIKSTTKAQQGLYEYDAVAACATANSAIRASTMSPTTSAAASSGRRSPAPPRPSC
jgi:MoxR-like ATPase